MKKKKQVIVVHGGEVWDTYDAYLTHLKEYDFTQEKFEKYTERRWKERLQEDLGSDFFVVRPEMPCSRNAKYDEWEIWFQKIVPYFEDKCIFVGHSLGANFLAKFLAINSLSIHVSQLHLVAGCFGGIGGGFDLPNDFSLIEECVESIYIYHSHDDAVVDFSDALKYKNALPQAKLCEFDVNNHFVQEHFPELVDNIRQTLV
jgi:uncharacterized protein